jgi:hypothetical protein
MTLREQSEKAIRGQWFGSLADVGDTNHGFDLF